MKILHLWADTGIEDEVLHTFGTVHRVGIDPDPNPFSEVIQADARNPPVACDYKLAVAHPPCQRYSVCTNGTGEPESHPEQIEDARRVCRNHAEHYLIENVPGAPLRDPVKFVGGMFGLPIHYPRCFETSFEVVRPNYVKRWDPSVGPLAEQGKKGNAWVGKSEGWRIAKGYSHEWNIRPLKRHAVPAPYLRRLLYWWLSATDSSSQSVQTSINEVIEA